MLAERLDARLGTQIVIENQPTGGGVAAAKAVISSPPDGHTLALLSNATAVSAALFKKLPYDPFKDFVPISELVDSPNIVIVRPDSGIKTVTELVERAKAANGTFNYSSPGIGTKSNLTGEELKQRTGIVMAHIPYRGAGPAALAVLEGTVQVGSVALPAAEPLVKSGKLTGLAVTGTKRWPSLPDVPTMEQAGFPGFISETFNALFAPAGTPPEIVALLAEECRKAFATEKARDIARGAGFEVVAGTPEQLAARMKIEIPAVKALVERTGLKLE